MPLKKHVFPVQLLKEKFCLQTVIQSKTCEDEQKNHCKQKKEAEIRRKLCCLTASYLPVCGVKSIHGKRTHISLLLEQQKKTLEDTRDRNIEV